MGGLVYHDFSIYLSYTQFIRYLWGIAGAGEERSEHSVGVGGPVDTPSLGMTMVLFSGSRIGILHNTRLLR